MNRNSRSLIPVGLRELYIIKSTQKDAHLI